MRRFLIALLVVPLLLVFGVDVAPVQPASAQIGDALNQVKANIRAQAKGQCSCFCGIKNQGATNIGVTKAGHADAIIECAEACEKGGHQMVTCAFTVRQFPGNNLNCFLQKECDGLANDTFKTVLDTKHQPIECPKGTHYCFPKSNIKTTLNIPIGELKTTGDIGEFVAALFNWLLFAGFSIAIVLVMVGGLQYAFGGISSGAISSAKERIRNAVIGFVLLLCVTLIMFTVNPQLLKLEPPQLPLVKQIVITDNSSCNALERMGYKVTTSGGTSCGDEGLVTGGPNGVDVPEGLKCYWGGSCTGTSKCLFSPSLRKAACVSCKEIAPDNKYGITPSPEMCAAAEPFSVRAHGRYIERHYCGHTQDPDMIFDNWDKSGVVLAGAGGAFLGPVAAVAAASAAGLSNAMDLYHGTCAYGYINCNEIKDCDDYEKLDVENDELSEDIYDLEDNDWGAGTITLKHVCNEDPCQIGPRTGTNCVVDNGGNDCVEGSILLNAFHASQKNAP